MKRAALFGMITSVLCLAIAGCHHGEPRPQAGPDTPFCPNPPGAVGFGDAPTPMPLGGQRLPEPPLAPAPIDSQSRSINYPQDSAWKPGPSVRLYPPEVVENSNGGKKSPTQLPDSLPVEKPSQPKSTEPAKQIAQPSAAPVGIPHFVQIREQLSNGLRPSLDDGMDWLQSHGYKTVLYIHNPATSANADRKQVEKRGMKFIDLELSPGTLSRQDSDEFSRIVNDKAAAPLFVYDRDGSLTGGLWYLHFRLTQQLSEEVARSQARSLGLRENGEGSHREMWLAAEALARDAGQKR